MPIWLKLVSKASIRDRFQKEISFEKNPLLFAFSDRRAFSHIPSISKMDLSNNRIAEIHNLAFRDVGNALKYLKMSNALYFTTLPNIAFHTLTSMEVLGMYRFYLVNS